MALMSHESRLPHSLRLVVFLLRVALGLNFFYVGFTSLFNPALGIQVREHSLASLYDWLGSPGMTNWAQFVAWIFLIVGVCLMIGLFTRLISLVGIILVIMSYAPTTLSHLAVFQIVNDELIVLISLMILIFAKAGTYLGMDTFMRFSLRHKK